MDSSLGQLALSQARMFKMKTLALCVSVLVISGCSSLPEISTPEVAWQAVHAVDFAQTDMTARDPDCYKESAWPTANIIGSHPSQAGLAAYWAAESAAHYAVSRWLDREEDATGSRAWGWARTAWYAVTIGASLDNVVHNHSIGLHPFGNGCPQEKRNVSIKQHLDSAAIRNF